MKPAVAPLAFVILIAWWTLRLTVAGPRCFLDLVDLPFHEAGHLIFAPFGEFLHLLGGTLGQLAVPAGLVAYFLGTGQPRAAAFCFWWAGQNLVNVSVYMADARTLALPLVGGGEHDWSEIFYALGLLGEDSVRRIAAATRDLGALLMLAGLLWSLNFVLPDRMRRTIALRVSARAPALRFLLSAPSSD